jgi:hypothetical protein
MLHMACTRSMDPASLLAVAAGFILLLMADDDDALFYPDMIQKAYEKLPASSRIFSTIPSSSSGEKY